MSAPTPRRLIRQQLRKAPAPTGARGPKPQHRIPADLCDALDARAAGRCELCGEALAGRCHRHHRKLLSQGGKDEITNLVLIHPACHHTSHMNPVWSKEHGWIVPSGRNPATVPVALHGQRRVRLTRDGGYQDAA